MQAFSRPPFAPAPFHPHARHSTRLASMFSRLPDERQVVTIVVDAPGFAPLTSLHPIDTVEP